MEIDIVRPGLDAYVERRLVGRPQTYPVRRWWTHAGLLRSMEWRTAGHRLLKIRDGFSAHLEPARLLDLLDESAFYGSARPGSYAGVWWGARDRPRVPTCRRLWRRWGLVQIAGAWQALLVPPGPLAGRWVQYDIRSAYLWALSLGVPDPRAYRWGSTRLPSRGAIVLGSFVPRIGAPYPYQSLTPRLATVEEIETYGLTPRAIHGVLQYGDEHAIDTDSVVRSIYRYSAWKEIARAWWGYLTAPPGATVCHTYTGAVVPLTPPQPNPIWGHLIMARVRHRLWEIVRSAPQGAIARVYVDSVVARGDVSIPIGEAVGAWRAVETYDHGLHCTSAVHIA